MCVCVVNACDVGGVLETPPFKKWFVFSSLAYFTVKMF